MPRNPSRMVERMAWSSLRSLLAGTEADRDLAISRLKSFAIELLKWNQGVSNLISHDDEPRVVDRHIAESLAGAQIISALGCNRLVDFGSGGGFPALPLALASIGAHWTLVESRRNKTLFLRRAVQELALGNVSVLTGRLETLIAEDANGLRCNGFTSRATMKARPTLEMAAHIVEPDGHAILWKGSGLNDELAAIGDAWQESWDPPVIHALGAGSNSICVFRRKK